MNKILSSLLAAGVAVGSASCGDKSGAPSSEDDATGAIEIALTQAPADASCLRLTVDAATRKLVKLVDLMPGQAALQTLNKLPLGIAKVSGEAFAASCGSLSEASVPSYVTNEPPLVRIDPVDVAKVLLKLVRNGRLAVEVDFEEGGTPYIVPLENDVVTKALLTVGDSVNNKADGSPYRMVGIADGTGAFDNGDGTFTLLINQELSATVGIERAHGAKGAFVSKWTIRKSDMTVLKGEDLIQQVVLWNPATSSYSAPAKGVAFGRFCSADLPALTAFYDATTGLGYNGRLFMNGEETGAEGRGMAHALDGTSYELPRTGKFSWENSVAHPNLGKKTLVAGMDDSGGGQVYFYLGTKTASGSPVDKAGLTNGTLLALKVEGTPVENTETGIPSGTAFTLVNLGNVENKTGAQLEADSNAAAVSKFNRPEDGAWDPTRPNDFYFVTTASFTTPTRLWRLRFADVNNPAAGGKIDLLLDNVGKMFDNITVDDKGRFVYLQEDPGGQDYLARMWRYDIAAGTATPIIQHDPLRFAPGAPLFLTRDEESSGIIDASSILGNGWFLSVVQAHYGLGGELVEGGQLNAIYDPAAK